MALVRLVQLYALSRDLVATRGSEAGKKRAALRKLRQATAKGWLEVPDLADRLRPAVECSDSSLLGILRRLLPDIAQDVSDRNAPLVVLEALVATSLPKGCRWSIAKATVFHDASEHVGAGLSEAEIHDLEKRVASALRRLSRNSLSPLTRGALAAGALGVTAASGGIATALGGAIGGLMGLSGAAATSAGLAALGGGSLAAGGFGMAGGTLLVTVAAKQAYKGGRFVATSIARESSKAFVQELAKLDVSCAMRPEIRPQVIAQLRLVRKDLERALPKEKDKKELKSSLRALDVELRYLTDPTWKRWARRVVYVAPVVPMEALDVLGAR